MQRVQRALLPQGLDLRQVANRSTQTDEVVAAYGVDPGTSWAVVARSRARDSSHLLGTDRILADKSLRPV